MKRFQICSVAALCSTCALGWAQQIDLSSLDKLASKATESRVITLDPEKIGLAGSLLDDSDKQSKELLRSLKSIMVRSFEFGQKGEYSSSDLEPVRKQLTAQGWSKVVAVKEKNEDVEIWFFKSATAGGLTVIAAENKELTVVNIAGPPDLVSLRKLAGLAGAGDIEKALGGSDKSSPAAGSGPKIPNNKNKDD